mmetsp:Transcript_6205/g.21237  ORF Transcript_6205/g.21237 Transcript_6205/m.21237 type:complete len:212 (-) Transcript_6205:98-733(-)
MSRAAHALQNWLPRFSSLLQNSFMALVRSSPCMIVRLRIAMWMARMRSTAARRASELVELLRALCASRSLQRLPFLCSAAASCSSHHQVSILSRKLLVSCAKRMAMFGLIKPNAVRLPEQRGLVLCSASAQNAFIIFCVSSRMTSTRLRASIDWLRARNSSRMRLRSSAVLAAKRFLRIDARRQSSMSEWSPRSQYHEIGDTTRTGERTWE